MLLAHCRACFLRPTVRVLQDSPFSAGLLEFDPAFFTGKVRFASRRSITGKSQNSSLQGKQEI